MVYLDDSSKKIKSLSKRNMKKNQNKRSQKRSQRGGSKSENSVNIVSDSRFSTSSFPDMKPKGIVHVTEAVGINVLRDMGTEFANFFGRGGFESTVYDSVKEKAFQKLKKIVSNKKYKVGNIKMDMETTQTTVFCHLIGTIYKEYRD